MNIQPIDIVALIVTVVMSVVILYPLLSNKELSEDGKEVYGEVIISYLSILLIYVGYRLKK